MRGREKDERVGRGEEQRESEGGRVRERLQGEGERE